jgi:hypothetical protein
MGRKSRAKALHRAQRERIPVNVQADVSPLPWARVGLVAVGNSPGPRFAPDSVVPSINSMKRQPPRPGGEAPIATFSPPSPSQSGTSDSVDPVERLRSLAARHQEINRALENEVIVLLNGGQSWTSIGRVLGLTRQGARQRYRRLLDRAE